MEEKLGPLEDTRELVARWHAATEEHFVHKLTELMPRLTSPGSSGVALSPEQSGRLARHPGPRASDRGDARGRSQRRDRVSGAVGARGVMPKPAEARAPDADPPHELTQ